MKKKYFKCFLCGEPAKLIQPVKGFKKIVCTRSKCSYEEKKGTPEETEKYFIDNGGRV